MAIKYIIMDERALIDPDSAMVLEAGEEEMTQEQILEEAKDFAPCAVSFEDDNGNYTFFHHVK